MYHPAKSAQTVLTVKGLVKVYGNRRVVDGVSFHVDRGEIVGLLGPNGAGKTTSFRMTCGLINTNGGTVYLGHQDVTDWPMYRRSRDGGMGYLPQDRSVFQKLTVQNNLYGVMEMLGMKRAERKRRCDELLEKFNLTYLRQSYGGSLSGGERRRLEIARSLVSNPKIILLDEPFAAIDPVTVASIQEIIRNLAADGIAILITDHSVQDTLEITKRSYVIQAGKVLCHGTPAEITANPDAQKFYFGDKSDRFRISSGAENTVQSNTALFVEPSRQQSPGPSLKSTKEKSFPLRFQSVDRRLEPRDVRQNKEPANVRPLDSNGQRIVADSNPSGKRLRPISSSILPDDPSLDQEYAHQNDPPMSSIIRNLGQMIWKK